MTPTTQRPQSDFLPKVGAGCLVLLGGFMAISALAGLFVGSARSSAGLLVMSAVGIGFGAAGVFWWRFVRGSEARRRHEFEEKAVLGVAARHGGVLSVAQVALETELTADEARIAVERLCMRGLAQPDVQDDGSIQYRFGGLFGPQ